MIDSSLARIFLADNRRVQETLQERQCFVLEGKGFGHLHTITDITLDAKANTYKSALRDVSIVLLPVVGAIEVSIGNGTPFIVAAGQLQVLSLQQGEEFMIRNPFEEELVNYLAIEMPLPTDQFNTPCVYHYDVNALPNELIPITCMDMRFSICVGKFSGRAETMIAAPVGQPGFFVFVIEGAFEVAGRLLHARDGLTIWNTDSIDAEALSNEAILLVMHTPL